MHILTLAAKPSSGGGGVSGGTGVQSVAADTFASFGGFNFHFDAHPYNDNFPAALAAARTTKQRVCRAGTFGSGSDVAIGLQLVLALETGVKFISVLNKGASYTDTSIEDYYVSKMDPTKILVLEGFNEVDNNNGSWGGDPGYFTNVITRLQATRTWKDAHANSAVRAILLSTATVTSNYGATHSGHTLDMSGIADLGAAHPYPGPSEPGSPLVSALHAVSPAWGSLTRVIVTETGYESSTTNTTPDYLDDQGVTELAQAKYTLRLFAEYFEQGLVYTTPYELMNDGTDANNGEANFGWFYENGSPKPVGTAVGNLQALMQDSVWTPPTYVKGTAYINENFTRANQTEWGTAATGSDTGKTWVPDSSGEFAISSNHGVVTATSQARNVIGDSHSGDTLVYAEYRNLRASYSNLCRTYARWSGLSVNYSADFNPGVSAQFSINKNGAGTTLASATLAAWSTLTAPNVELMVLTRGNDNILHARVWDSVSGSRPTEPTLVAVDFGGASGALAAGKETIWVDNNSSGQSIYLTAVQVYPITTTPGSFSTPATFTPAKLDYTLTGAVTNVHAKLFQKSDASFWLMMWNRVSSFNSATKADISNTPAAVTLTLNSGGAKTANTYLPRTGLSATSLGSHTSFSLAVPDDVMLVQLT